ncbi:hypothetical protein HOY82DRAFT_224645 [Tuber indicum]|nr:hypothetical protein HOY82DRAFT_224645 [Tuber indicum]
MMLDCLPEGYLKKSFLGVLLIFSFCLSLPVITVFRPCWFTLFSFFTLLVPNHFLIFSISIFIPTRRFTIYGCGVFRGVGLTWCMGTVPGSSWGGKSVWSCCREANSQSLVKCIKEIQVCTRGLKGVRERRGGRGFSCTIFQHTVCTAVRGGSFIPDCCLLWALVLFYSLWCCDANRMNG